MHEDHDVLVVGAGFGGLGTAIRLVTAGRTDFAVLERADEIGGTWRDNAYPGAACDVPSHLYSFSFAPNPDWHRSFSPQSEIQRYLLDCTHRYRLDPYLRLGHELLDATWDADARRWRVRTSRGSFTGRVLVVGAGQLSEPRLPNLPGLDRFAGAMFHSSRWDHARPLAGSRVAVIGTGASAIQFVPRIAPEVGHLSVFQRTPPWIIPRADRAITEAERFLYRRLPGARAAARAGIWTGRELLAVGMTLRPALLAGMERVARRHLARQVPDPALREALTPGYRIGCKRILLSNDYYPALLRPNVDLVTDRIAEVGPDWIATADGTRHAVDTIIFGTGFAATKPPIAERITGTDGVTLAKSWADGMSAYRGTAVAGYPNMFMLLGPNTGLGHSSMIYVIESQLNYLMSALAKMDRHGIAAVDVDPGAQDAYNEAVQDRLVGTVWNVGGCASWYLDANGRNTTLWPSFTWRYRRITRDFDPRGYRLDPVSADAPGAGPAAP